MGAVPAFWWTVVFNLVVLWVAVALAATSDEEAVGGLPVVSVALSVVVGLGAFGRADRRRLGVGLLAGAAASAALLAVLVIGFFVTYFVLGGHELS